MEEAGEANVEAAQGFLAGVFASPLWIILSILAVAAATGYFMLKSQKGFASNDLLDAIGVENYDFEYPAEVEAYEALKSESPDDTEALKKALFKRALADVPIIRWFHQENMKYEQLAKSGQSGINETNFENFEMAHSTLQEEMETVQTEADELEPEWSKRIWTEATQVYQYFLSEHRESMMSQERDRRMKEEAKKAKKSAKQREESKKRQEEKKRQDADKAMQELMKLEEQEKSKKKGGAGLTQRKNSKKKKR